MAEITPKQFEILLLLYRFRFLDRKHIQKFLKHKDPRRINAWLKDLTEKNIIGRKYSTSLKENTLPAVYYLITGSRKYLLEKDGINSQVLNRVYREKLRSERLIDHCLLLTDIYFILENKSRKEKFKITFVTKTELANYSNAPSECPDAYILVKTKGDMTRIFFEIIDQDTPRFALRKKMTDYVEYIIEGTWKKTYKKPYPSLFILCPNEKTKKYLSRYIPDVLSENDLEKFQVLLCTRSVVLETEWKKGIWDCV